ncbi:hypothetical protein LCGC14_0475560 [marine sediment metagenome]|uniref:Uncharacterized protein n=1 Tax=marine sediment metagenome TaxID=412755 RepID=A0A0F9VJQ5_9ZZZZ
MKTYSVAIKVRKGYWVTNWDAFFNLSDIDWADVLSYCKKSGHLAFGYYYGWKSNELTSARCRTELAYII